MKSRFPGWWEGWSVGDHHFLQPHSSASCLLEGDRASPALWPLRRRRQSPRVLGAQSSRTCDGARLTSQPGREADTALAWPKHPTLVALWLCYRNTLLLFYSWQHSFRNSLSFSLSYKHLWLFFYFLFVYLQAWYTTSDKREEIILFISILPGCSDHPTGSQNLYVQCFRLLTASFLELLSLPF